MEPQPAGGERKPRVMWWWLVAIFFLNAVLSFVRGAWLIGALFAVGGVVFWKHEWVDRQPKWFRYLLIALVAAGAVFSLVQTIQRVRGRW